MPDWTIKDIPPQTGRIAVITGANSGIGYEAAKALAGAGAKVIIASRNEARANEALARIRAATPGADVTFEALDLASLDSVARTATRIGDRLPHIDLLINNAGVMAIPDRHETEDGFEMQMGANYIGHFAWTMRLLPKVFAAENPRVVTVSSLAHRSGRINFDDLQWRKGYRPWPAYCQSKLATLLFSLELDRIARAEGWKLKSVAAHPGYAATGLQTTGPRMGRDRAGSLEIATKLLGPFLSHTAAAGALPTLFAATSPAAESGAMYGPNGFYELKGPPVRAKIAAHARDQAVWRRLWDVSEQLTG
ncbi:MULTISPECIES: oxidoreductase [unclassified Rhizobium]|uniref:oxidoreductase n=1 Tax=Rhizobium TaxID=379 RepID=UPI00084CA0E8|nr:MULTISPECIES: oxidoreductase [unclassified Rhizobium]OED00290.1 short-chain dehydrogenase [Rhizobium sp. YK2]QYA13020.1 SDR family oxidoreductase [Rhizobium sp. AB2/73]UEQ81047.1 SDR family oxidoreductase [Rhizobium sp. AB2/73]